LLEVPEAPEPLSWSALFGNDHPVEIEVGFGKGLFLRTESRAHPERNYLGIEILRKYQLEAATRLVKEGIGNVRVAKADAREFLATRIAPASVSTVHVYFPDPWWKTRHHKRRLFTNAFAAVCERVLMPGGKLSLATDVEEYFHVMTRLVAEHTKLLAAAPPPATEPAHDLDYLTHFERKFRKEGRPIYRAIYLREPSPEGPSN
jgi:tRNA (guanine-N7-)-methyltransferase